MKAKLICLALSGFVLLLGGCVVVPLDPGYASGPVYVAPVVRGYWGYGRGYGGYGYRYRGW